MIRVEFTEEEVTQILTAILLDRHAGTVLKQAAQILTNAYINQHGSRQKTFGPTTDAEMMQSINERFGK